MITDGNSSTMAGDDITIKWTNHFKYLIIKKHYFFLILLSYYTSVLININRSVIN